MPRASARGKQALSARAPEGGDRLYDYIEGIVRAERCILLAAGGMSDHIHLLVLLHPSVSIADLMRVVKSRSSGWIHQSLTDDFAWQTSYGAFSVSQSNKAAVVEYIARQEEHHRRMTYQEEFILFLERHRIEYDARYIWS